MEDYSTYPGDDAGQWEFGAMGRSGGWLVLMKGPAHDFRDFDLDELSDPECYSFADIKALYRALTVMDSDFAPAKVRAEFLFQIADHRAQWEEGRRECIAELSATIAEERGAISALVANIKATKPHDLGDVICSELRHAIWRRRRHWRDARRELRAYGNV